MNTIKTFKILMAIVVLLLITNIALALTYTKNSWPTYSGYVISCDGDDTRVSCQDSGNGRNHWCNSYGTNGCQAFEGRNNYGSPGCLITCQRAKCSDGTSVGQCSTNNPLFCDSSTATLVSKASVCGCVFPKAISGENCVELPKCTDGTFSGQCSPIKPQYCNNGVLINKASSCGCPSGQVASGDNCINQTCGDGTQSGQCSSTKPLFCQNGSLVNKASNCGCPSGQSVSGDNCTSPTQQQISGVTGKLAITDIDAEIDGKKSSNLEDNDRISKEAKPESSIELKVKVANQFNETDDLKIEDIVVKTTIEEIDEGDDLEDESKEFDLRAGDDKTVTFKFKLPLNVDEGTFDVAIEAEGEDENGTEHSDSVDLELEVEKEKHDLRIIAVDAKPTAFNCTEFVTVNFGIINVGQEDETNARLEITNQDIGLAFRTDNIQVDSGTTNNILSKLYKVELPEILDEGTYSITISVFSPQSKLLDSKVTEINVGKCPKKIAKIAIPSIKTIKETTKLVGEEALLFILPKGTTAKGLVDLTSLTVFERFYRSFNIWSLMIWLAIALIVVAAIVFVIVIRSRQVPEP